MGICSAASIPFTNVIASSIVGFTTMSSHTQVGIPSFTLVTFCPLLTKARAYNTSGWFCHSCSIRPTSYVKHVHAYVGHSRVKLEIHRAYNSCCSAQVLQSLCTWRTGQAYRTALALKQPFVPSVTTLGEHSSVRGLQSHADTNRLGCQ